MLSSLIGRNLSVLCPSLEMHFWIVFSALSSRTASWTVFPSLIHLAFCPEKNSEWIVGMLSVESATSLCTDESRVSLQYIKTMTDCYTNLQLTVMIGSVAVLVEQFHDCCSRGESRCTKNFPQNFQSSVVSSSRVSIFGFPTLVFLRNFLGSFTEAIWTLLKFLKLLASHVCRYIKLSWVCQRLVSEKAPLTDILCSLPPHWFDTLSFTAGPVVTSVNTTRFSDIIYFILGFITFILISCIATYIIFVFLLTIVHVLFNPAGRLQGP